MMIFEVCVEAVEGAQAAQQAGVQRIELCSALALGGITPSFGLISLVRQHTTLELHVLVRSRSGDFCYSDAEMAVMLADIQAAKALGVQGIVTGALHPDGSIDVELTQVLAAAARPLRVTFHRAFDCCQNLSRSLEQLISLGIERVLTSGGQPSAWEGRGQIAALVQQAAGRIVVMPGGGINEENMAELVKATGADEFHFSARSRQKSSWLHPPGVKMGTADDLSYRLVTDAERIRRMMAMAQNLAVKKEPRGREGG